MDRFTAGCSAVNTETGSRHTPSCVCEGHREERGGQMTGARGHDTAADSREDAFAQQLEDVRARGSSRGNPGSSR